MTRRDVAAAGSLGDGLHDDTGPLLATIDRVRAAGGGEVVLPPGTYRLTGPLPAYSRITYRGPG
ncbi:MAG: glycosyl hydrolase family 28-related protein [Frankiaceae bacterium]